MLRPQLANAEIWHGRGRQRRGGDRAGRRACAAGFYDALVGIGGGRTLDVAKHAASLSGAADGRRSRRASPTTASPRRCPRSRSTAAARAPSACRCRSPCSSTSTTCAAASPAMRRSGIGDAISQPVGDRRLAAGRARARRGRRRRRGHVRAHGRDGDPAPRGRHRRRRLPDRARRGARALRARDGDRRLQPPVQRRRPRDPARDRPPLPGHRAPRRARRRGERSSRRSCATTARPRADRRLPAPPRAAARCRADLGLSDEQFAEAVAYAPRTRPDRYTILEHLDLDDAGVREHVGALCRSPRSLSCARRPSRRRSSSATAASTGRAGSTCGASRRT